MRETRDKIMDGASVALRRRDGRHLEAPKHFFQIGTASERKRLTLAGRLKTIILATWK
jgi:hypothetical protein